MSALWVLPGIIFIIAFWFVCMATVDGLWLGIKSLFHWCLERAGGQDREISARVEQDRVATQRAAFERLEAEVLGSIETPGALIERIDAELQRIADKKASADFAAAREAAKADPRTGVGTGYGPASLEEYRDDIERTIRYRSMGRYYSWDDPEERARERREWDLLTGERAWVDEELRRLALTTRRKIGSARDRHEKAEILEQAVKARAAVLDSRGRHILRSESNNKTLREEFF